MHSAMTRLPAHLPAALPTSAPLAGFAGQSIGGWRFGGIRGVLFPQRQLLLQVGDLLLLLADLLFSVGDLLIPLD